MVEGAASAAYVACAGGAQGGLGAEVRVVVAGGGLEDRRHGGAAQGVDAGEDVGVRGSEIPEEEPLLAGRLVVLRIRIPRGTCVRTNFYDRYLGQPEEHNFTPPEGVHYHD